MHFNEVLQLHKMKMKNFVVAHLTPLERESIKNFLAAVEDFRLRDDISAGPS